MIDKPLVSVLIPCYNCEQYVKEAVMSIMKQSYANLEILVINDGSTDNTGNILKELAEEDTRIVYIKNEKNLKLIATLNKGLDRCKGKYIARMDADDISVPTRIEKQVDFLEKHPNIGIVGADIEFFKEDKKLSIWRMETKDKYIRTGLLFGSCFAHPVVMMRTSILREHHLYYNDDYPHAEDYKLWCDIAQCTKLANIPEVLLYYRVNENQVSNIYNQKQKETAHRIKEECTNLFFSQKGIPIKFNSRDEVDYLKKIRYYIKDKYILKKFLLDWYYSSKPKREILKQLLTSKDIIILGLKNTMKIFYHKIIKHHSK